VRAAIEAFTQPGDLVLDNHVGGGTTLVEALALGRHSIGVDISALAEFVATVKTTIYNEAELNRLLKWAKRIPDCLDVRQPSTKIEAYAELGYYRHLDSPSRWRLRKAIEQAIASAVRLHSLRLEAFARCSILNTARWALDGRKKLPSFSEFRQKLIDNTIDMVRGAGELLEAVQRQPTRSIARVLKRSSADLEDDQNLDQCSAPKLVITSPPYPGVHMLYHRWQVDGRKETPLPFMIANKLDGAGSSHYTMGDRHYPELKPYFENVRSTMSSVAKLSDENTVVVQMIAFSDHSWQLGRYLETMEEAGLVEAFLPILRGKFDGRLWRSVPNRRWYSDQRGTTPGSQEVVLLHTKKRHERVRVACGLADFNSSVTTPPR
jgi:hypothetical protein